jgi:sugar lactone lactonase YvrE
MRRTLVWLAVVVTLVARDAAAELVLAEGFSVQTYLTGDGFDGAAQGVRGVPSSSTLAFDADGTLYLSRTGRRYFGGEVEDVFSVYRVAPGGGTMTPKDESRHLYGPPLPNPQVGLVRSARDLLVTTFDRERRIGVLYRIVDGRADMLAGGTPERGVPPLLRQPEGVAVDSGGHVYVADRDQGVVVKLDATGRVIDPRWFAVSRPRLLAVDPSDRVWVGADGAAEAPWQRGPGEIWTVAANGVTALVLRGPVSAGMALSPGGHLFVADRQAAKILFVTADGRTGEIATFTDGDAPRALRFAPVTAATRRAGMAGDLFVLRITRGTWRVNEVVRISGPFDDLVRQRAGP